MKPTATLYALLVVFVFASDCLRADEAPVTDSTAADRLEFVNGVAPILREHCFRCHQPGDASGEVSLDSVADLFEQEHVVPGNPDESYLLDLITESNGQPPEMPKDAPQLDQQQIGLIRKWIERGAAWPEDFILQEESKADRTFWSLQPLGDVEPPVIKDASIPVAWKHNPIDRFVARKLVKNGLRPSARADKRVLIRRATYDLIGLPPTPEEIADFLADDTPDAFAKVVDRLLASPHYGERWGRHWLDVIRFGESNGFERNIIIDNLWPFRDYVIDSFNADKPFDQLVREHLAADAIDGGNPAVAVGTAFLVCGPYDNVGNKDQVQAAQIRANTIDEMIRATSESMLGLTVGCARCHHHKFDPISQADYYRMYASLAGVVHGDREIATAEELRARNERLKPIQSEIDRLQKERGKLISAVKQRGSEHMDAYRAKWVRPKVDRFGTEETFASVRAQFVKLTIESTDANPNATTGTRLDEFEVWTDEKQSRNVALQSAGAVASGSSRVAEDAGDAYGPSLLIDGEFGASWIATGNELTIRFSAPESIHRIFFSSDRLMSLAADDSKMTFVGDYRISASLDGQQWNEIANSHDRLPLTEAHANQRAYKLQLTSEEATRIKALSAKLASAKSKLAKVGFVQKWWIGNFQKAEGPFHVFVRGDPQKPGDEVQPASLSTLADVADSYQLEVKEAESQRRLKLANWIVADDNPLTPRVLANRVWHYHFGTGIVDTPSDFGYMGGRPSHPELLDWLAGEIRRNKWQLKPIHKSIMLSETYRQANEYSEAAANIDSDSRLLWRFPPRRLSAEEIRDSMLAISGKLDTVQGGTGQGGTGQGGAGFRLYRYLQDNVATYIPLDEHGPETYRRAVYHQNARAARTDLMTDFDQPDCAFSTPRRAETTTPLQALASMNHAFTLDMAAALAQRLRQEAGDDNRGIVRRGFLLCYGREPAEDETRDCEEFIQQHSLAALCRVLMNTSELIHIN